MEDFLIIGLSTMSDKYNAVGEGMNEVEVK